MQIIIALTWIVLAIIIGALVGILGKRYGIVYPSAFISSLVVMSNVFSIKIIQVGPYTVPAGVITFSIIFFVTDLISENWGKKEATKAVWAGFYSNLVFVISIYFVIRWQPANFAVDTSENFTKILALTPRITIASFVAYLVSQHHDVWAYHFWKKKTNGKHLWLRNNISTMTSQLIDSSIFITIAFYGIFQIPPLIIGQCVIKLLIALIDTPFIYGTNWLMRKVKSKY